MRFYAQMHRFHRGVALHVRSMHVCILDQQGKVALHKNLPAGPEPVRAVIVPFREALVVAAQCMVTRYSLADLCAQE